MALSLSRAFRAIPSAAGIKDPLLKSILDALIENQRKGFGLDGNTDGLFPTQYQVTQQIRDAITNPPASETGTGEPPILPIPVINPSEIDTAGNMQGIYISWPTVVYDYWLAYFEVLRSGDNVVGNAVVIGSTQNKVYFDPCGPSKTYYYWVRIVQKAEAGGEIGALPTEGKQGQSSDDPSELLTFLTGVITESQLFADLAARIDLIDGSGTGSVNERDGVLQSQITALAAIVDSLDEGGEYGAEAFLALEARVTTAEGNITTQASSITQLQTTVGNHTTVIQEHAESVDGLEAQYTVKIDANGKVIGFGLASGDPNEAESEFAIRADRFYVVFPTGDGSTSIIPFVVGMVDGVSTVGISGQLVVDGSVLARAIAAGAVTATKINVSQLAAISADMGAITAGTMNINNGTFVIDPNGNITANAPTMQSVNYSPNVSGWRLTREGNLYLTNIVCIGTANIQDGAITNAKIGNAQVTTAKIGDAQVTNAKIVNAAVTTLKIGIDAVTVPASSYAEGSVSLTKDAVTTVSQVTVDPANGAVHIHFAVTVAIGSTGSDDRDISSYAILTRNGTEIFREQWSTVGRGTFVLKYDYPFSDYPGVGATTYAIRVYWTAANPGGSASARKRSLIVQGIKR
jgi:hypothetical protein